MKRFFAWVFRIICIAVIAAAGYTLISCILHMNDDHSQYALMSASSADASAQTADAGVDADGSLPVPAVTISTENQTMEQPIVSLDVDGKSTSNKPLVTATASFTGIENSILAKLTWYLNGELIQTDEERLLVEGSTVSCPVEVDVDNEEIAKAGNAELKLEISFADRVLEEMTSIVVESDSANKTVIKTEEIPAKAKKDTDVYEDDRMLIVISTLEEGEEGLIREYETDNSGVSAYELQLKDGTTGWVDASDVTVSKSSCTTDKDYTESEKVKFVNDMGYDSATDYLIWVNLYTQKVNVFKGYKGSFELEECFSCSSGKNDTPTTIGTFVYNSKVDRWNLGTTYVEPVLIYHEGEAITSQPYNTLTDTIAEDTIGEPASSGSIRLLPEDIDWMSENIPLGTMVVVY